ncbi:MAG: hypothetical protein P8X82_11365, partial [Gemmatimonadales bacterium]
FQEHGIQMDRKMATALAAGIITDTLLLRQANAAALRRLSTVLQIADLYVEDVIAVIDGPGQRETRRSQGLVALQGTREVVVNGWSILATEAASHDQGIIVVDALKRLGADVSLVSFPREDKAMVLAECDAAVVRGATLDLASLMAEAVPLIGAEDSWGTPAIGRIIAPTSPAELLSLCIELVAGSLRKSKRERRSADLVG